MSVQQITLRRGTTAQWSDANPILMFGEIGVEIKTDGSTSFKLGDSTSSWSDLPYFESGSFADFISSGTLGQANGVATLDSNGVIPLTQLSLALSYINSALASHEADTTNIHGIADTSKLATTTYVDNVASGIIAKPAVEAATTTALDATYTNGTLGVGALLTSNSNGAWAGVDGVTTGWNLLDGILVKNQTNPSENGRYVIENLGSVSTPWVLRRCSLCDEPDEIPGMYIFVKYGDVNAGAGFVALVNDPESFTVGTDAINITQFAGGISISAGTGIVVNGTQVSIDETTIAKLSNPTFSGTLTAPTISSTNISATTVTANLTGTASNASKIGNRQIFVQSTTPTGGVSGDIWIKTA